MKRWFVVLTKPHMEERAVRNLQKQGFETYLPRYRKRVRHARKVQTVLRPLFPNYLFVHLDLDAQRWHCINSTFGVASLVPYAQAPSPVPPHVIDAIQQREDSQGAVGLAPDGLKRGDKVRIRDGALLDCHGLFDEVSDDKRVFLLLNILGREVRVTTDMEKLAKVS